MLHRRTTSSLAKASDHRRRDLVHDSGVVFTTSARYILSPCSGKNANPCSLARSAKSRSPSSERASERASRGLRSCRLHGSDEVARTRELVPHCLESSPRPYTSRSARPGRSRAPRAGPALPFFLFACARRGWRVQAAVRKVAAVCPSLSPGERLPVDSREGPERVQGHSPFRSRSIAFAVPNVTAGHRGRL